MKIFITGANGYIGRHVAAELLEQGHSLIAADRNYDNLDERVERFEGDIFSPDESFPKVDALIHFAWMNGFVHNDASHISDLPRHFDFIKNIYQQGCKQIIVMGSMHEVGFFEGKVDGNTPTNPGSLYAIAKNSLRQSLQIVAKDSDMVLQWLRGFYITGDDEQSHSIFTKIIEAEKRGDATFPLNSGKNEYDFIDIHELAKQISAVVSQTEVDGIINVCSGKPVSLGEKVEVFIKENHFSIRPEYGAFPDRPYDSKIIYGDNSKIQIIMKVQ